RPTRADNAKMKPATQNMDRICKVIGRMRLSLDSLSGEELACAVWPQAVGAKIAKYSRASKLVRTHLIVEVEDATWQRNLNSLSKTIMRNIERAIGSGVVDGLEFRVMPRRREPVRATE